MIHGLSTEGPSGSPAGGVTAAAQLRPRGAREPVLRVRGLTIALQTPAGTIRPVRDISFDLFPGQRLGLVGESGCGKSLTARALMRLLPYGGAIESGEVLLGGEDVARLSERQITQVRGARIAMVSQNALASLNPIYSVGRQLVEAIVLDGRTSAEEARKRAMSLLDQVGIPSAGTRMRSYPHELSGGMRQRVVIAMALARRPQVIIADEATTALDVTTQARVLDLLDGLVAGSDIAVILITHDLGVAARFCDAIHVMYAGRIVEKSSASVFFERPSHPYSRGLLSSICRMDADVSVRLPIIAGRPPLPQELSDGCSFAPRCPFARAKCSEAEPEARPFKGAQIECVRAGEIAPEEVPDGW